MVKRGGKTKARTSTSDDCDSVTRNRSVTPILEEPEEIKANQQQTRRTLHRDNTGSFPMMTEPYDRTPNPTAFQMQSMQSENSQALLAHAGFQKPKCSHCHRIGHTVEKCYKVHGYPPGHPQRNKANKQIGSTNLAATPALDTSVKDDKEVNEGMTKEHIQSMISYLSSQLQNATSKPELLSLKLQTPSSTSAKNFASSSTSVPHTSQITDSKIFFPHLYNEPPHDEQTHSASTSSDAHLSTDELSSEPILPNDLTSQIPFLMGIWMRKYT
ncbi:hypothetical protein Bca52824_001381 [Brassica carinata]|uniref:Uncharacterized protein n=1 Tax=Brassica carinata TaxID=52824 RepID=A0A8X7WIF4_BRACI|nr:hypothetical protein Bca52824_001381 [Brassica carinata]